MSRILIHHVFIQLLAVPAKTHILPVGYIFLLNYGFLFVICLHPQAATYIFSYKYSHFLQWLFKFTYRLFLLSVHNCRISLLQFSYLRREVTSKFLVAGKSAQILRLDCEALFNMRPSKNQFTYY